MEFYCEILTCGPLSQGHISSENHCSGPRLALPSLPVVYDTREIDLNFISISNIEEWPHYYLKYKRA